MISFFFANNRITETSGVKSVNGMVTNKKKQEKNLYYTKIIITWRNLNLS